MMNGYVNIFRLFQDYQPNIFCLSENIKKVYKLLANVPEKKLYINPNGVNSSLFKKTNNPNYPDRSIYLAKIDYRKRQHLFQSIDSLWYAGNIADSRFNTNKNYLEEWDKNTLYNELTNYGNLVLLSDGEAHSLVLMEALASGLGIVISEFATANLDLDKEFIDVIPENKIGDIEYIESVILKNREYSVSHREEIIKYSKQFSWDNILKNYYIPNVEKVIGAHDWI